MKLFIILTTSLIVLLLLFLVILPLTVHWPFKLGKEHFDNKPPFPIDVVIPWSGESHDLDGTNRDDGIIKYVLRSLVLYAPWIQTIYIFKDPPNDYPSWIDKDKAYPKIQIIDRCTCFENKNHCPTNNSAAAYANMYKIKNLSEYFIEWDDDIILNQPVKYTTFFTQDGKIVSPCTGNEIPFYDPEKVKKGPVKPPKSPPKFSQYGGHIPIPNLKSIYQQLANKYPKFFDFISSHKNRWNCCNNDICIGGKEHLCGGNLDELSIEAPVPHLEAKKANKYIYKPFNGCDMDIQHNIQDKLRDKKCDVVNFNDSYFGADAPKTKEELQKYNSLKNKVHKALEKKFPKQYFEK